MCPEGSDSVDSSTGDNTPGAELPASVGAAGEHTCPACGKVVHAASCGHDVVLSVADGFRCICNPPCADEIIRREEAGTIPALVKCVNEHRIVLRSERIIGDLGEYDAMTDAQLTKHAIALCNGGKNRDVQR